MQPLRLSTRLISGARVIRRPLTSKPLVSFSHQQHRFFARSTRLHDRLFAFPTEPREPAGEAVPTASHGAVPSESTEELEAQDKIIAPNVKFILTPDPAVKWHPVYLRERRHAGPEVVERQTDSEQPQLSEDVEQQVLIFCTRGLSDVENQLPRRKLMLLQKVITCDVIECRCTLSARA